ncbi:hypothetical protein GbCGDNIH6_8190 [Granulibacter bethesdensis]|nr:hypothetical protein GbCGDNIH6_8190 [Granulibacter bethesdensis]
MAEHRLLYNRNIFLMVSRKLDLWSGKESRLCSSLCSLSEAPS